MYEKINLYDGKTLNINAEDLKRINTVLDLVTKKADDLGQLINNNNIVDMSVKTGESSVDIFLSHEYQTLVGGMNGPEFLDGKIHPLRAMSYFMLGDIYPNIPSANEEQIEAFKETGKYFKDFFIIQTALIMEMSKQDKDIGYIKELGMAFKEYFIVFNKMIGKQTTKCEELSDKLRFMDKGPKSNTRNN